MCTAEMGRSRCPNSHSSLNGNKSSVTLNNIEKEQHFNYFYCGCGHMKLQSTHKELLNF